MAAVRWLAPAGKSVSVPAFVGMQLDDATQAAGSAGIGLNVLARRPDFHAPKDRILGQLPAPGEQVRQGRNIDVIVSDGVPSVKIPNLSNMSLRDARVALENERLELGRVAEQRNPDVIAGVVLSQQPDPFAIVPAGTKVDVTVATGHPLIYAPNFVGFSLSFAEAAAKEAGIKLDKPVYRPIRPGALPKGTVEEQVPRPGQTILPVQKLALVVSGGAPPTPQSSSTAESAAVAPQPSVTETNPLPSPNAPRGLRISVALPASGEPKRIRVVLLDARGSHTLYDQKTTGGSTLSFDVIVSGSAALETYVDDALISTTPL